MAEVQPDIAVYRLMEPDAFAAFRESGRFEGSSDDRRDGFVHFSRAHQVPATAAKHYAGHDTLVLVEVATAPLIDFMRWEEGRDGELFPHLYGVLDWESVRRTWELGKGADGFPWPEGVGPTA